MAQRADALAIVRCTRCRLAFVNPRPTPADIAELYGERYFDADVDDGVGYSDYPVSAASIRRTRPYLFELLAESVPLRGRRAVDVGCAFGSLVYWLDRAGARASGIDVNPRAVAWGRREMGLDLRCGTLESLREPPGSFDVITMIDVIEHVVDLGAFVEASARLLARGGHVFVQTPNFGAYPAYGDRCRFLSFSLEHLLYFEADALDGLMRDVGLAPAVPTRVLVQGPRAAADLVALISARKAWWRRLVRRLPIPNPVRWIPAWAMPTRPYRFDPSGREGDIIVGVYTKQA